MEITDTIADAREQEIKSEWNKTWLIANSFTGAYDSFDQFWNDMQEDDTSSERESVTREEAEKEAMRIEKKFDKGMRKVNPYEAKA